MAQILWLLLFGVLAGSCVWSAPTERDVVSKAHTYCNYIQDKLFCDFQNSGIHDITLEPLSPEIGINKVFVHNAEKLYISAAFCTNLALQNCDDVVIDEGTTDGCETGYEFAAKTTHMKKVPEQVTKIYLELCNVATLATNNTLRKLTLLDSEVGVVNISSTFGNNTALVLNDSRIGTLEKLILETGVDVTVFKMKITNISSEGLVVNHGHFTFKETSFSNVQQNSIVLNDNSMIYLESFSGNMHIIKPKSSIMENRQQEPSDLGEKDNDTVYIVVIACLCVVLAAIMTGFIIYLKSRRKKSKLRNYVESTDGKLHEEEIALVANENISDLSENDENRKGTRKSLSEIAVTETQNEVESTNIIGNGNQILQNPPKKEVKRTGSIFTVPEDVSPRTLQDASHTEKTEHIAGINAPPGNTEKPENSNQYSTNVMQKPISENHKSKEISDMFMGSSLNRDNNSHETPVLSDINENNQKLSLKDIYSRLRQIKKKYPDKNISSPSVLSDYVRVKHNSRGKLEVYNLKTENDLSKFLADVGLQPTKEILTESPDAVLKRSANTKLDQEMSKYGNETVNELKMTIQEMCNFLHGIKKTNPGKISIISSEGDVIKIKKYGGKEFNIKTQQHLENFLRKEGIPFPHENKSSLPNTSRIETPLQEIQGPAQEIHRPENQSSRQRESKLDDFCSKTGGNMGLQGTVIKKTTSLAIEGTKDPNAKIDKKPVKNETGKVSEQALMIREMHDYLQNLNEKHSGKIGRISKQGNAIKVIKLVSSGVYDYVEIKNIEEFRNYVIKVGIEIPPKYKDTHTDTSVHERTSAQEQHNAPSVSNQQGTQTSIHREYTAGDSAVKVIDNTNNLNVQMSPENEDDPPSTVSKVATSVQCKLNTPFVSSKQDHHDNIKEESIHENTENTALDIHTEGSVAEEDESSLKDKKEIVIPKIETIQDMHTFLQEARHKHFFKIGTPYLFDHEIRIQKGSQFNKSSDTVIQTKDDFLTYLQKVGVTYPCESHNKSTPTNNDLPVDENHFGHTDPKFPASDISLQENIAPDPNMNEEKHNLEVNANVKSSEIISSTDIFNLLMEIKENNPLKIISVKIENDAVLVEICSADGSHIREEIRSEEDFITFFDKAELDISKSRINVLEGQVSKKIYQTLQAKERNYIDPPKTEDDLHNTEKLRELLLKLQEDNSAKIFDFNKDEPHLSFRASTLSGQTKTYQITSENEFIDYLQEADLKIGQSSFDRLKADVSERILKILENKLRNKPVTEGVLDQGEDIENFKRILKILQQYGIELNDNEINSEEKLIKFLKETELKMESCNFDQLKDKVPDEILQILKTKSETKPVTTSETKQEMPVENIKNY